MPKHEKVTDRHLMDIIERCGKADVNASNAVSVRLLLSMALELKQLRAEKKCKCWDRGKPSVIGKGECYSLSYANPEDIECLENVELNKIK